MAPPHISSSEDDRVNSYSCTAVAIDKDKNSQFAVKWAIDNLFNNNPNLVLIHVRTTPKLQHRRLVGLKRSGPPFSCKMRLGSWAASNFKMCSNLLSNFGDFKGTLQNVIGRPVQAKEVILEDSDVSKALLDYISTNCINNIVVGASTRNALTRKFRNTADVPTSIAKSAPEFCAVYVISKGKVLTSRAASRPASNTAAPPRQSSLAGLPPSLQPDPSVDPEDSSVRAPFSRRSLRTGAVTPPERRSLDRGNEYMKSPARERPLSSAKNTPNDALMMDNFDLSMRPQRATHSRDSFSDDIDFTGGLTFRSCDISNENLEFSNNTDETPRNSVSSQPSRELEAEMRRLKLELRQTMDMYSTACKEAISAKQKAQELHQWKVEEARKFEEARLAEEAALQIAEMEKAKCKAAIEAAEAAQRLAEMESQRRRNAEMKAMKEAAEKKRALDALAHNDVRYRKYTLEEIEAATNNFADSLKIGEGGYGPVYKATLDHTRVAIKVLRPDAAQGKKQFQQEIEVLSCMRHPNMVLLLGACPEYGCLVYEYMDYGSLDDRIFRRGNTPPIPWRVRFKIAAEIATALLFLHQAKPEPLVHRDLKPANILLDHNYVSKISDVGLSRLVPPSVADTVTQYRMTSTAGTFCYIDPEYQSTGMLGVKSDIYSFGILLLQIVTAKPPMGLTHHVERAIERGTFAEMLDPMIPDWPMEDVLSYAKMALKCAELRRKDRPDLGSVVLPELNRLRNLGGSESSVMSHSFPPRSPDVSRQKLSNASQNQEGMKSNATSGTSRRSSIEELSRNSSPVMSSGGGRPPKIMFEDDEDK
ncbi:Protein kinase domain [Macleaya cordata]|uniref:RING-type E3 ubiquitin transferase n=1 Tax=Macleaya cordata TaxID=56857 RepID=A0A200QD70_MACCD|nr:Protein kinase domain [Macleaya cordata]